jgi:hypothetical protein
VRFISKFCSKIENRQQISNGACVEGDVQMGMDGVTQEEVQQDEEFVDYHLTRALCDVIQDINQKKADNLLKSIHRLLRESGRTKFPGHRVAPNS